ncbi:MAG: hypothetical protein EP332_00150 [Bacteroidetes bacterium]|nr:MAG: hypothetical protein EP332_00150 [Bacteroidota bacterium]
MPPKPEYWTLKQEKVKELINEMEMLADRIFESLNSLRIQKTNPYSNWKIGLEQGWIGFTIEKLESEILIMLGVSLKDEETLTFGLELKYWNPNQPDHTLVIAYESEFESLNNLKARESELKEKLISEIMKIPSNG